jgi:hypothetical protein
VPVVTATTAAETITNSPVSQLIDGGGWNRHAGVHQQRSRGGDLQVGFK